jgi:hypothetical protein
MRVIGTEPKAPHEHCNAFQDYLPALWTPSNRIDAYRSMPVVLSVQRLRQNADAVGR